MAPRRFHRLAAAAALAVAASPALAQDAPGDDLSAARERALAIEGTLVEALAEVRRSSVSILIKRRPEKKDAANGGGDAGKDAGKQKGKAKAKEDPEEPEPELQMVSCGSGVIVQRAGKAWVLTNHHVIEGGLKEGSVIEAVTLDGVTHVMEVHDSVPKYDMALLRFADKPKGIRGVSISKQASNKLEEGQWVLATGNPFFLATDGASVSTLGVVSGLERVLDGRFRYGKAIQHDAEVNPGNSGGPLWNLKGEFVGMNGMIITANDRTVAPTNSGASFSIPADQVASFMERMVNKRKDAQAGFLGVACETATDGKGIPRGAMVVKISPVSPARTGGAALEIGDVIESISKGGSVTKIRTADDLTNALALFAAGAKVRVKYRRGRKSKVWSGALGSQP